MQNTILATHCMRRSVGVRVMHVNAKFLMQALPFWKVSTKHNCTALKERNEHLWYVSNVNFFHGILHKTKELGVYTTVIVIAIALIVVQYQLASLKQKISDLKTENEALKNSIKDEKNKLSFTISDIEQSIEIIENNINRLKKEDIHEINDNIKDLKSWLRNVGQIATSTRDKLNPSMDD